MKIKLLFCLTLIANQFLHAQLPKGPDGKTLYQKGECKVLVPNVSYKCTFCEDKDLKVNCKEYDCSLTNCTESKSVKGTAGNLSAPISIEGKMVKFGGNEDSLQEALQKNKIDITELLIRKKVTNGTSEIYQSEGKYKVYAIYKKGKLTNWYAVDVDGNRSKQTSQLAVNETVCENCQVLPGPVMICQKCTVKNSTVPKAIKSQ